MPPNRTASLLLLHMVDELLQIYPFCFQIHPYFSRDDLDSFKLDAGSSVLTEFAASLEEAPHGFRQLHERPFPSGHFRRVHPARFRCHVAGEPVYFSGADQKDRENPGTAARPDPRPESGGDRLGNRRWRVRSRRQAHGSLMGYGYQGPMRQSGCSLLLQAVGRSTKEKGRAFA